MAVDSRYMQRHSSVGCHSITLNIKKNTEGDLEMKQTSQFKCVNIKYEINQVYNTVVDKDLILYR